MEHVEDSVSVFATRFICCALHQEQCDQERTDAATAGNMTGQWISKLAAITTQCVAPYPHGWINARVGESTLHNGHLASVSRPHMRPIRQLKTRADLPRDDAEVRDHHAVVVAERAGEETPAALEVAKPHLCASFRIHKVIVSTIGITS